MAGCPAPELAWNDHQAARKIERLFHLPKPNGIFPQNLWKTCGNCGKLHDSFPMRGEKCHQICGKLMERTTCHGKTGRKAFRLKKRKVEKLWISCPHSPQGEQIKQKSNGIVNAERFSWKEKQCTESAANAEKACRICFRERCPTALNML